MQVHDSFNMDDSYRDQQEGHGYQEGRRYYGGGWNSHFLFDGDVQLSGGLQQVPYSSQPQLSGHGNAHAMGT